MKKILYFLLILLPFLILTGCDNNKPVINEKEAVQFYLDEEYEKALPLLEKSAFSGSASASFYLGEMYAKGKGVDKNQGMVCQRYLEASKGGYKDAYLSTAICYYLGNGLQKNDSEAFTWAKKVEEEIDENSLSKYDRSYFYLLIQTLYFTGKGTLQDFSEAAKWTEKAAELGKANSQGILAILYYNGNGVLTNKKKARYWAEKAALQGDDAGELVLGFLKQYSLPPEQDMPEAIDWYKKAAAKGNIAAQFQLADIYEKGLGVPQDLKKARSYYEEASKGKYEKPKKALAEFEARYKKQN